MPVAVTKLCSHAISANASNDCDLVQFPRRVVKNLRSLLWTGST